MNPGEIFLYVRKSRIRGLDVVPLRCKIVRVNGDKTVTVEFLDRLIAPRKWSQVVAKNLVPFAMSAARLHASSKAEDNHASDLKLFKSNITTSEVS